MTMENDTREYVDARELHPGHTTIPCMECGDEFYVQNSFALNYDEWYCEDCKPQRLRDMQTGPDVTVRI